MFWFFVLLKTDMLFWMILTLVKWCLQSVKLNWGLIRWDKWHSEEIYKEWKTCSDLGVFLYHKNSVKAPKKTQNMSEEGRGKGELEISARGTKFSWYPGRRATPHDLALTTTTIGQESSPSGRNVGLAWLGNPAESGLLWHLAILDNWASTEPRTSCSLNLDLTTEELLAEI